MEHVKKYLSSYSSHHIQPLSCFGDRVDPEKGTYLHIVNVKVLVKQKMFTPAQPGLEAGQGGDLAEPPLTEDGGQAALTLTFLTILTILCDLFVDRGHLVGSHSLFFIYGLPALTPHINRDQRCSYVPSLNSGIFKISLNK